MGVKKRPVSPRQKMINLMYIVLLAMLALNVSSDVLNGFALVEESLRRTTGNAMKENQRVFDDFEEQLRSNPAKVKAWFDKARQVKQMSDSLYDFAEQLKLAIAREADGDDADPTNLEHRDDLEAADEVMLRPVRGQGQKLYEAINSYRTRIMQMVTDSRQRATIASNLSTEVPRSQRLIGKNWQEAMFDNMPAAAAITLLTKLQNDVRYAEGEVLHTLVANVDVKDIRVNQVNAYVIPEATTLFPGQQFRSQIIMAAVDTTQRPEIYVNGRRISSDGSYSFSVGAPGEYSFSGYIQMPNPEGDLIRRPFTQKYNVIAPPTGATVAADLMNVLYAGFDNPISVSASGVPANKISVSMTGGTLTPRGNGSFIARPAAVGQDVTFNVTGVVNGRSQTMGSFTFKVRKLPDPTAYIIVGDDRSRGGRIAKAAILSAPGIGAAIDDGLLDIPFRVLGFEAVFFDTMGNARPESSSGANFTDAQRNLIRSLRRGQRFYISRIQAVGPDGIQRTLPNPVEVIIN